MVSVKCSGVSKFDEIKIPPHEPTREIFNEVSMNGNKPGYLER
jgi:hypothetical protein